MDKLYRQHSKRCYNISVLTNKQDILPFKSLSCKNYSHYKKDSENKEFRFKKCSVLEPIKVVNMTKRITYNI